MDRLERYGNEHAWKGSDKKYYMMSTGGNTPEKRRVDPIEYTRLNGGIELRQNDRVGGVYTPTRTTTNVPMVDPKKPLTNTIYKQ